MSECSGENCDHSSHKVEDKSEEIAKAFSEVAAEFAEETAKDAVENPDALKMENQNMLQQMEFNSKFFKMYSIQFDNMMNSLSLKSARRVIKRLIKYPLETPSEMVWQSKKEQDAFLIGNQLLEVKYLMFKYILNEKLQKEVEDKKVEEAKVNEGVTENGQN
jgi:hypothetical protein